MKKTHGLLVAIALITCTGVFAQAGGPIAVEEDTVVAEIGGVRRVVGSLAFSDDPFFGFGQTYAFNPERDAIAYVGEERGSFGLYVYQAGARAAVLLPSHGEITGRTR